MCRRPLASNRAATAPAPVYPSWVQAGAERRLRWSVCLAMRCADAAPMRQNKGPGRQVRHPEYRLERRCRKVRTPAFYLGECPRLSGRAVLSPRRRTRARRRRTSIDRKGGVVDVSLNVELTSPVPASYNAVFWSGFCARLPQRALRSCPSQRLWVLRRLGSGRREPRFPDF